MMERRFVLIHASYIAKEQIITIDVKHCGSVEFANMEVTVCSADKQIQFHFLEQILSEYPGNNRLAK